LSHPSDARQPAAPAKLRRPLCDTAHDGLPDSRLARGPCTASGTECERGCLTFPRHPSATSTCHDLQRHDHLLSWRRLVNPGHWRGRSIQPCLRPDRLAAAHSPTCGSPNIEDLSIDKPLSQEAAACGREDRHRTGGAVILVWVGIMLVRMAEIPETSSSRTRLGTPRESTVERGAGPPTCAE
jgi:hypothetical protein